MKRYYVIFDQPALAERYGLERYVTHRRYWSYKAALKFIQTINDNKKSYTQTRLVELRIVGR